MRTSHLGYTALLLAMAALVLLLHVSLNSSRRIISTEQRYPTIPQRSMYEGPGGEDLIDDYIPQRPTESVWFENGCEHYMWNRGIMECQDGRDS
mmetsp:Transcript_38543/g.79063  ORF Transcript_38543/g.79063 Transcript_38543/m.79063 type:complete len:94 (-) Transcript_38543:205-486(-)